MAQQQPVHDEDEDDDEDDDEKGDSDEQDDDDEDDDEQDDDRKIEKAEQKKSPARPAPATPARAPLPPPLVSPFTISQRRTAQADALIKLGPYMLPTDLSSAHQKYHEVKAMRDELTHRINQFVYTVPRGEATLQQELEYTANLAKRHWARGYMNALAAHRTYQAGRQAREAEARASARASSRQQRPAARSL